MRGEGAKASGAAPRLRRALGVFAAALAVYASVRVGVVLLLGFSAGLPLALSAETLRVWMADRGVDVGTIGLVALASLPYTVKFLWAPIVDALQIPWLSARLGRRRAWLVATQLALMATIVWLGTRDPVTAPLAVGVGALMVAFASATQDIVIDAFRVESLSVDEQAAGMAGYVAAYRIGMLASGAGVVVLTAWLEADGWSKTAVWPIAYGVAALLILVGLLAVLLAREPAARATQVAVADRPDALARVLSTAREAFTEFLSREAAFAALAFVVLYKLCDALAGAMTAPFVLTALGYDKATYAAIVKGLGLAALLIGGFAGGVVARALPLATTLWLGAILQMVSNLAFVWLWYQPPSAVGPGDRDGAGELHRRHRHGDLHCLPLGALPQPAAHGDAVRAAHRPRLRGENRVRLRHRLRRRRHRLAGIFRDNDAGCAAGAGAARLAAAARALCAARRRAQRQQVKATSVSSGSRCYKLDVIPAEAGTHATIRICAAQCRGCPPPRA